MKLKCLLLFAILFSNKLLLGQNNNQKPFIIRGQLDNISGKDKFIYLNFTDDNNNPVIDSAQFEPDGKFYLASNKVTKPVTAKLSSRRSAPSDLFIAPGYDLTLTGDAKNYTTISATRKITGNGSKYNRYFIMRDSVLSNEPSLIKAFKLKESEFLGIIDHHKNICDSIARVAFGDTPAEDKNAAVFKKDVLLNIDLEHSYYIIFYAADDKSNYQETIAFVKNNLDKELSRNLFNDAYITSSWYLALMSNYYQYLESLDCKKDSALCNNKSDYHIKDLEKITGTYKGKVKNLTLYSQMRSAIIYSRSYEELNMYTIAFPKYMAMLNDEHKKSQLNDLIASTTTELNKNRIGKAAPDFSAADSLGKTFSLADFKGKVILIDLWASWCGPCRGETPYLKKIEEKYKADNRIAFISIAVNDHEKNWKTAMMQDKVTGIQLFDKNKTVVTAYSAYSIPKFVLVSKDGKIVSFDAPMPDKTADLEKMLDEEINK